MIGVSKAWWALGWDNDAKIRTRRGRSGREASRKPAQKASSNWSQESCPRKQVAAGVAMHMAALAHRLGGWPCTKATWKSYRGRSARSSESLSVNERAGPPFKRLPGWSKHITTCFEASPAVSWRPSPVSKPRRFRPHNNGRPPAQKSTGRWKDRVEIEPQVINESQHLLFV